MPIYLGLDCSTQSLTAVAIDAGGPRRSLLCTRTLDFDAALPSYGTTHGVLRGDDPLVAGSPPLIWVEALDLVMEGIAADLGPDALPRIAAVAGSAQQHGSVYLNAAAAPRLAFLDAARPLAEQIAGTLARATAPVWMDSSTSPQCRILTEAAGGADALARLTGSRAFERFTGPQIRKFFEIDPEGYASTDRIHLVSSFMASLLAGRHAPIDPGDGSGMNLMDIAAKRWSGPLLRATAPALGERLPPIAASPSVLGTLHPYWQKRYGFPPAKVVAWSGDNPCSLVGVGLVTPGRRAISLGTSDTVFGYLQAPTPDPAGTGHVFGAPTGDYMGLTCFRNGSLARERIRDAYGLDWTGFSALLRESPPGNHGRILLPWFEPEITPHVPTAGARRFGLDPGDAAGNVRGVVEGQVLAMARHSRWMGGRVDVIHATGGGSVNREILQVIADVFGADVYRLEVENSACLGAALRAYHADMVSQGTNIPWEEVVAGLAVPDRSTRVAPNPANRAIYRTLSNAHERDEHTARTLEP
jgi:xylulokinase